VLKKVEKGEKSMRYNFVRSFSTADFILQKTPVGEYHKHPLSLWRPKALKKICIAALVTIVIISLGINEVQSCFEIPDMKFDHTDIIPLTDYPSWEGIPWGKWTRSCTFTLTRARSRQRQIQVIDWYFDGWVNIAGDIGGWEESIAKEPHAHSREETQTEWQYEWDFSFGLHQSLFSRVNYGVITGMAMDIPEVTDYVVYVDGKAITPPLDFSLISVGSHDFDLWVHFQNGTSTNYSSEMRILNYIDLSVQDNFHRISQYGYTYYEVNVTNNSFDTTVVTLHPSSVPDGWLAYINTTVQLAPQTSSVVNLLVLDNTAAADASATITVTGKNLLNYTASASTFTAVGSRVGGIVVPVNKFGLLAPYIGLASTILVATAATAIYVKRVKRRKEKQ
jgi:hypothetical protein